MPSDHHHPDLAVSPDPFTVPEHPPEQAPATTPPDDPDDDPTTTRPGDPDPDPDPDGDGDGDGDLEGGDLELVAAQDLAEALRRWARGAAYLESAVLLLTTPWHVNPWLHRVDFRRACIHTWREESTGDLRAWFDPAAAAHALNTRALQGYSDELRLLHLIVHLAGQRTTRAFGDLLPGLDPGTLALVLDAIAHAASWHHTRLTHTITGTPTPHSARTLNRLQAIPARHRPTSTSPAADDTTASA